jgi:hypothetical protein
MDGSRFPSDVLTDSRRVAREFPDVPVETLKTRYRRMKAKTKMWSEEAVFPESGWG